MHLYDFRRPFPEPYIPRHLTFEIPERIGADGKIVAPLDIDPAPRVPFARGQAWKPSASACYGRSRTRRTSCARRADERICRAFHNALAPAQSVIREYGAPRDRDRCLAEAADAGAPARDRCAACGRPGSGAAPRVTSLGGVLAIGRLSERPIFAVGSGPSMAPVAAAYTASTSWPAATSIVCDSGGTSFDVAWSATADVSTRETWLGEPFDGPPHGLASVDVRASVPEAAASPGSTPAACCGSGPRARAPTPGRLLRPRRDRPTVTDAALVLGYLDPTASSAARWGSTSRPRRGRSAPVGEQPGLDSDAAAARS